MRGCGRGMHTLAGSRGQHDLTGTGGTRKGELGHPFQCAIMLLRPIIWVLCWFPSEISKELWHLG